MLCPKCKNPVDYNAIVCEWCGALCKKMDTNNVIENDFDAELIALMTNYNILQAVKVCKDRTGMSLRDAKSYVDALYNKHQQSIMAAKCTDDPVKNKYLQTIVQAQAQDLVNQKKVKKTDNQENGSVVGGCIVMLVLLFIIVLIIMWIIS